MGAFYGSVHVRSDDGARLRRTLEELAARSGTRFLMAPPSGGWIAVYPSHHGQDVSVSAAIAARVTGPVLHLLVHDDDVFAYTLYDAGGPIDEYCSDPDYFESSSPARRAETAGRPDALAALVGGADAAEFARALERKGREGDPFRATWQMRSVAELLRIVNVETSYEYLREGETRGVKGWKELVHVPDLATEKEARRRRQAEVAATTSRLQREGVLLLSKKRPAGRYGLPPLPVFCAHPLGGFLLAWCDLGASAEAELEWWRPPWHEPADAGFRVSSKIYRMRASPTGRFLAVGHASGEWSAALLDLHDRRRLATVPLPRATEHLSFTPDERTMICRSQGELRLVSTGEGHSVRGIVLGAGRSATVHPDGRWLVADVQDGGSSGLALVDLGEQRVLRVLSTARNDLAAWMAAHAAGKAETGFHPQEVPNKVDFTPDGRLIVLAAQEGVRLYSWEGVLRADASLPAPVASADADLVRVSPGWMRNTYGFAFDRRRALVFFSGLEGRVRALSIETGRTATVLEVPGTPPVIELALGVDGDALATVAHPGMFDRGRKRPAPVWQVWSVGAVPG